MTSVISIGPVNRRCIYRRSCGCTNAGQIKTGSLSAAIALRNNQLLRIEEELGNGASGRGF
jgi:hypothetical protein